MLFCRRDIDKHSLKKRYHNFDKIGCTFVGINMKIKFLNAENLFDGKIDGIE